MLDIMDMKKLLILLAVIYIVFSSSASASVEQWKAEAAELYETIPTIKSKVRYRAFWMAYVSYKRHAKKDALLVIDYDASSLSSRAIAIDMSDLTIYKESIVSHGKNSGGLYAKKFSNNVSSYQTSLGPFVTRGYRKDEVADPSWLKYPNAIVMVGKAPKLNGNAEKRAIIAHQAWYVKQMGNRLGRSQGCPAFPEGPEGKAILEFIKDGGVIFAYSDQLKESDII
ncbi:MAG: hypothetical protein CFH44_00196 [Proteobacteria bacterium]|nr:MAG: hypothetical protein CFH44_00196 [Pseudomonadota bacterium]|tara:strand:+ start:224 stop:901 length:678 start_codon:yes stop_codon:yes gene_type:complete